MEGNREVPSVVRDVMNVARGDERKRGAGRTNATPDNHEMRIGVAPAIS